MTFQILCYGTEVNKGIPDIPFYIRDSTFYQTSLQGSPKTQFRQVDTRSKFCTESSVLTCMPEKATYRAGQAMVLRRSLEAWPLTALKRPNATSSQSAKNPALFFFFFCHWENISSLPMCFYGCPTLPIMTCVHPKGNKNQTWLVMEPHSPIYKDLEGACVTQEGPNRALVQFNIWELRVRLFSLSFGSYPIRVCA